MANDIQTPKSLNDLYNKRHLLRLALYQKKVDLLLSTLLKEVAALGINPNNPLTKPFSFNDFPRAKAKFDDILGLFRRSLLRIVLNGVNAEWELANDKNDALADLVFGRMAGKLTPDEKRRYYKNNEDALEAFRMRVTKGMNLSDRVWNYSNQFKKEIEMALDVAIGDGVAATRMASELKQYLKYPDKLFRRVRDKHGNLQLSKAAAAFHPSTGVYRSSYKNALRLARTETNMAYRSADHLRYQQLDFVVGIQIHLSNNHTCLGRDGKPHPFRDICDDLQGRYPKDFKFVGWHPQCRCFVTSILMSYEEIDAARAARKAGKPIPKSKNEVTDVPQAFKDYLATHKDAIDRAANKPYWCVDNYKYTGYGEPPIDSSDNDTSSANPRLSKIKAKLKAKARHAARTSSEIKDIRIRWFMRGMNDNIPEADKMKIAQNWLEIEKEAGVKKGAPMSLEEADMQNANPNYGKPYYDKNCATCAPCYVLRTFGFDFTAKSSTGKLNAWARNGHVFDMWLNPDGTKAYPTTYEDWLAKKGYIDFTDKRYEEFFEEVCKEEGIYIMNTGWKSGRGHATIVQRFADGTLKNVEPQHYRQSLGSARDMLTIISRMVTKQSPTRGVMRVDNKLFDTSLVGLFNKKGR